MLQSTLPGPSRGNTRFVLQIIKSPYNFFEQETQNKAKGPNFTITKKDASVSLSSAQLERNKTKEQIEEEKRISLSFRIKPLNIEGFTIQKLQSKARELWDAIVKLETEKYDLEERQKRQDYDVSIFKY